MSDHGKTIDTLPTKDETTLSLTDTLLGVDAIQEPAAFQATLGAIAARLVEPLGEDLPESSDFLDALADGLISRLIGSVESNADGSYVRLENGLQVCWAANAVPYGTGTATWNYPAAFIEAPVVVPIPRRGSSPGTFSLRIGAPVGASSVTIERTGGDISVDAIAVGKWR